MDSPIDHFWQSVVNIILTLSLPPALGWLWLCPGSSLGSHGEPLSPGSGLAGRWPGKGPVFLEPAPSGPGGWGPSRCLGLVARAWSRMLRTRPATHFPIKHSENIYTAFQGFSLTNCFDYCVKLRTGTFPWCCGEGEKIDHTFSSNHLFHGTSSTYWAVSFDMWHFCYSIKNIFQFLLDFFFNSWVI